MEGIGREMLVVGIGRVTCLSKEEDISSSNFFSLARLEMDCGVERGGDFALDIKLVISRP